MDFFHVYMIQVTISLVVTSDKIDACSVYTQQAYLRAACVSVDPRPRESVERKGRRCNVTIKQKLVRLEPAKSQFSNRDFPNEIMELNSAFAVDKRPY